MDVISEAMTLVGRKPEQERFSRLLDAPQPLLLLVQGEHGSGKTSLLHALQTQLVQRPGWSSAPDVDNWPLAVTPDLDEIDFSERVSTELGISASEEFSVAKKMTRNISPLVESLARQAPLALFIDGYQPNWTFERWFREVFLPDVARSGAAILVVLADEPKNLTQFDALSLRVEIFALGRLKPKDIRERFALIDSQAGLSLTAEEMDYYVQVVREKPEYYKSLARLLQSAGKKDAPAAESA